MQYATIKMCACVACKCEIEPGKATKMNGQLFCSKECGEGHPDQRGCGHADCAC